MVPGQAARLQTGICVKMGMQCWCQCQAGRGPLMSHRKRDVTQVFPCHQLSPAWPKRTISEESSWLPVSEYFTCHPHQRREQILCSRQLLSYCTGKERSFLMTDVGLDGWRWHQCSARPPDLPWCCRNLVLPLALGRSSWTPTPGRGAEGKIWLWRIPVCPFLSLSGINPAVHGEQEQSTDHLWVGELCLCAQEGRGVGRGHTWAGLTCRTRG